jgi:excisionase family DNA binding protein
MQIPNALLTATEIADKLAVAPSTVIRWAKTGRIPEVRLSPRTRRFSWDDVVGALRTEDHARAK